MLLRGIELQALRASIGSVAVSFASMSLLGAVLSACSTEAEEPKPTKLPPIGAHATARDAAAPDSAPDEADPESTESDAGSDGGDNALPTSSTHPTASELPSAVPDVDAGSMMPTADTSNTPPEADAGTPEPTDPIDFGTFDSRPELDPVPADAEASWTVLVYLNADNNLEEFGLGDLEQMAEVTNNTALTILVQIDRAVDSYSPGYTSAAFGPLGEFTSTKRVRISHGEAVELDDLGETNMGSANTLASFVRWGVTESATGHYGLVLWDHGGGWDLYGPDDSANQDGLDLLEVADGISRGLESAQRDIKLDLVGFDACLMGTFETAAALRPYAETLIASQELEPGTGWDWRALQILADNPATNALALGKAMLQGYATEVGDVRNATLSVTDLTKLDELMRAFATLAEAMKEVPVQTVGKVRAQMPEFAAGEGKALIDLAEFVHDLAAEDSSLDSAATAVLDALDEAVVWNYHGQNAPYAHGLSLYFPRSTRGYQEEYAAQVGIQAWQDYLKVYLEAGQDLGEFVGFTNPDHIGTLEYDSNTGTLYITGDLARGTTEKIVAATTNFGIVVEQSLLLLGSTDGTWNRTQAQGAWDLKALVGIQGNASSLFFYSLHYAEDSNTYNFTTPVLYNGTQSLNYQVVLDENLNSISEAYYGDVGGAVGEVAVPDSGTLQPIVYVMDGDGNTTEVPLDTLFDLAGGDLEFSFEPVGSGTEVMIDLDIEDFGGNTDYVYNITTL